MEKTIWWKESFIRVVSKSEKIIDTIFFTQDVCAARLISQSAVHEHCCCGKAAAQVTVTPGVFTVSKNRTEHIPGGKKRV